MKPTSLCFPIRQDGKILLGKKKKGFGAGKYNGFGGKLQEGETFRQCAVREVAEECGLIVNPQSLEAVGLLDFQFPYKPELTHIGWVYLMKQYDGLPLESEEMDPQWFEVDQIPYEEMWKGDAIWLPLILDRKKIKGVIVFGPDQETVEHIQIVEVKELTELNGE